MAFFTRSPLAQRRLALFCANRRGVWALALFSLLFGLSLVAEGLANDKPLFVRYDGQWLMPAMTRYAETDFGGDFETEADYKDPHVQKLILARDGWMLFPPIPYDASTIDYDPKNPAPSGPSAVHWLGTDDQGRDVLARVIYGFRVSVLFGLALTAGSAVLGILIGGIQGFLGGWTDLLLQRFSEIWSGLPVLYMLMILSAMIEPTVLWLLALMLLFSWLGLADLVRAEVLRARNFDYVRAARALGVSEPRILLKHVLPNALVSTFTFLPFILSGAITTLTSLDFLGFGLPPGSASLGELLAQAKANPQAPWLGWVSFGSLAGMLVLLMFIGDAVRDAFDPRKVQKVQVTQ